MPKFNAGYTVLPVRSMNKINQGFYWKVVSQSLNGRFDIIYFEYRSEAEQMCLELNVVSDPTIELLSGAA